MIYNFFFFSENHDFYETRSTNIVEVETAKNMAHARCILDK
jgi:hypothetical protein